MASDGNVDGAGPSVLLQEQISALIQTCASRFQARITARQIREACIFLAGHFRSQLVPQEPGAAYLTIVLTDLEHDDVDAINWIRSRPDLFGSNPFTVGMFSAKQGGDAPRISAKLVQAGSLLGPDFLRDLKVHVENVDDADGAHAALLAELGMVLAACAGRLVKLVIISPTFNLIHGIAKLVNDSLVEIYMYSGQNNVRGMTDDELKTIGTMIDAKSDANLDANLDAKPGRKLVDLSKCKLFENERNGNFLKCLPELKQHLSPCAQAAAECYNIIFNAANVGPQVKTLFRIPPETPSAEAELVQAQITAFRLDATPVFEHSIKDYARMLRASSLWPYVASYKVGTVQTLTQEQLTAIEGPMCDSLLSMVGDRVVPDFLEEYSGNWWLIQTKGTHGAPGARYTVVSKEEPNGPEIDCALPLLTSGRAFQHRVRPGQESQLIAALQSVIYPLARQSMAIEFQNS